MLSCAISLLIFVQDFLFDQYINLIFRIMFIDTFVLYLLPLYLLFLGIIWPLEAIPEWLRYISICLPQTYAAEAMRCVLSRGNHHSKILCCNYKYSCSSITCISITSIGQITKCTLVILTNFHILIDSMYILFLK